MIKQSFTLSVTMLILSFLCPAFLNAQIVTDERMFSFEEPQLPACITGVQSQLGISGAHYKDGKHSLEWTFEPNGRLELRKDHVQIPITEANRLLRCIHLPKKA